MSLEPLEVRSHASLQQVEAEGGGGHSGSVAGRARNDGHRCGGRTRRASPATAGRAIAPGRRSSSSPEIDDRSAAARPRGANCSSSWPTWTAIARSATASTATPSRSRPRRLARRSCSPRCCRCRPTTCSAGRSISSSPSTAAAPWTTWSSPSNSPATTTSPSITPTCPRWARCRIPRFAIEDGRPLGPRLGLYVHHPDRAGKAYYAVVPAIDGAGRRAGLRRGRAGRRNRRPGRTGAPRQARRDGLLRLSGRAAALRAMGRPAAEPTCRTSITTGDSSCRAATRRRT